MKKVMIALLFLAFCNCLIATEAFAKCNYWKTSFDSVRYLPLTVDQGVFWDTILEYKIDSSGAGVVTEICNQPDLIDQALHEWNRVGSAIRFTKDFDDCGYDNTAP